MKSVVQRVSRASVTVDHKVIFSISTGFLVLLGIHKEDTEEDIAWMARKIASLRVFEDEKGTMNKALKDIDGEVLVVSQFTLIASNKKGNRPSFNNAASPEKGNDYYLRVVATLETLLSKPIQSGAFGANMQVDLQNDGPVTITYDSRYKE